MPEQQQVLSRFILAPSEQSDRSNVRHHFNDKLQLKRAAVLIPLVPRNNGFNVLLTRRAAHLKHHPGQISFPGGRFETEDQDLINTAIRETQEETGITCYRHHILGSLAQIKTSSGYVVTPFLSTIDNNYIPIPDPNEVDTIFEVPLNYLLDPQNIRCQQFKINGQFHHIYAIPYNNYSIWGATALIIKRLSNQIWHDKI